jgi:glutamyl-Q tRNA(Asp) synthetase
MGQCTLDPMYVGRFAPSPTGPLHFGSLVAALASWLDARAVQGRWLVRIEDLDRPREQPGAACAILEALERLGLWWDGSVEYQSRRASRYRAALERLSQRGLAYPCGCSRREIVDSYQGRDVARAYPGTCRGGIVGSRTPYTGLAAGRPPRAVRVRTSAEPVSFVDRVQGRQQQSIEREIGDFVVQRADGPFAYQLAVVVDDAEQGVTDVVRGADLLDSTPRQIYLQRLLGYPQPRYMHVPVALNARGEKLSKQTGAPPVECAYPARTLQRALSFLGQRVPASEDVAELLGQAVLEWQPALIPRVRAAAPAP